jgi:calcium/calmodulin-dependent protein kinase I
MAPEVALKKEYSKSVDIWSIGIIMYNLLTGGNHPLYQKSDSVEMYKAKLLKT